MHVNVDLYSASSRTRQIHYRFAYVGADFRYLAPGLEVGKKKCPYGPLPFPSSPLLPSPSPPFPLPVPSPSPSPTLHLPSPLLPSPPLRSRPLKSSYRAWGTAVSSPAESGEEPQPKSNSVHFSLKIWHLVATILIIFWRINWSNLVSWFSRKLLKLLPPDVRF